MIELESTSVAYGAPLDRLFGEPGEVFVVGVAGSFDAADAFVAVLDDPLVTLGALLDDGFPFQMPPADTVAAHDFIDHAHVDQAHVDHAHVTPTAPESWSWDPGDTDWIFGPHG